MDAFRKQRAVVLTLNGAATLGLVATFLVEMSFPTRIGASCVVIALMTGSTLWQLHLIGRDQRETIETRNRENRRHQELQDAIAARDHKQLTATARRAQFWISEAERFLRTPYSNAWTVGDLLSQSSPAYRWSEEQMRLFHEAADIAAEFAGAGEADTQLLELVQHVMSNDRLKAIVKHFHALTEKVLTQSTLRTSASEPRSIS